MGETPIQTDNYLMGHVDSCNMNEVAASFMTFFYSLLRRGPSINYVVSIEGGGGEGGSPKDNLSYLIKR